MKIIKKIGGLCLPSNSRILTARSGAHERRLTEEIAQSSKPLARSRLFLKAERTVFSRDVIKSGKLISAVDPARHGLSFLYQLTIACFYLGSETNRNVNETFYHSA
jgi:hypothetical protein